MIERKREREQRETAGTPRTTERMNRLSRRTFTAILERGLAALPFLERREQPAHLGRRWCRTLASPGTDDFRTPRLLSTTRALPAHLGRQGERVASVTWASHFDFSARLNCAQATRAADTRCADGADRTLIAEHRFIYYAALALNGSSGQHAAGDRANEPS